ncbi:hypothetical protein HWV62_45266, partial [Athelia sp. TMB]
MVSISATLAQCPCIASAERISLPESPMYEPAFQRNAALAYSERHQVHSTLSQMHGDLAALDDALAHITSIQTRLLEKRDAMQAFSDKLKVLISPTRITPPEIYAEIFSYLKGDYRDEISAHARTGSLLPTHVCQQWREIALSIPSLWNNVYINHGDSDTELIHESEVECVTTWLARAKDCPLSVNLQRQISWWDDLEFESDDVWNEIFEILVQNSHRWRHAILLPRSAADFSGLRNNLPLLEVLEFKCPLGGRAIIAGNAFEFAPRLRSVTLFAGNIHILPWAQLNVFITDLVLTIQYSLTSLQKMPNLVSLSTEIFYQEPEASEFINTPLKMTKLENLSVVETKEFSINHYLKSLTLPSLKSIKLSSNSGPADGAPDDQWIPAAVYMIQRSACSIKSFEIDSAIWNGQSTLGDFLRVTPQLETLIIGWNTQYDFGRAVRLLLAPFGMSSVPCLAPKLQHLNLLCRSPFEPQAFVDMVKSRWQVAPGGSVTRLRSIQLIDIPSVAVFGSPHLERLKEFAAEGLDIKLYDAEGEPVLYEIGSTSA